jgi:tetratricopeptide (TPR) repeat protein
MNVHHSIFDIRYSIVLVLVCCCALCPAQRSSDSEQLFSPSVGQIFYEIGYELANSEFVSPPQAQQALIFLIATTTLDSRAKHALPEIIKLASRPRPSLPGQLIAPPDALAESPAPQAEQDYSLLLLNTFIDYMDQYADLAAATQTISYLLEQADSREQREEMLQQLLLNLRGKNAALDSELATLLGLLAAEKADQNTALSFFKQAYDNNKYNRLAFAKLVELAPEQITPSVYLEHIRLELAENPLDIEAALRFAQYAEKLQIYGLAADSYEYCADLFRFLQPSEPLPPYIYLPWALNCYNTQRNQHRCLQIAEQLRQTGRFDPILEAIAARAALKIGNNEQADRIFRTVEEKINNQSSIINNQSIAWFYCFANPDPDKALDWANKAFSTEPNSPTSAAILAYTLVMNGQADWAKTLVDNYPHNQIADLVMAQIQLQNAQPDQAIETLKSVIASDPPSLEAEKARDLLTQQGRDYIPPIAPDVILLELTSSLSARRMDIVPAFVEPQNLISIQLNTRGSKFSYGTELNASIAITNNSSQPLVVSDSGLFKGNIRVDADVTGDLNKKLPNLLTIETRPTSPVEPGRTLLIPVRLFTGQLRHLLLTYPQASLDIEFTTFIDPVITDEGPKNAIPAVQPARLLIKRPAAELSRKFLQTRLNSLSRGQQGQKIKTAQLFVGLLAEQHALADRQPSYKLMYTDWMPPILKSALVYNLADNDWLVKTHTMAAMLSLPLDYELTNAVAENLNDTHWPARMMAIYLLAKNQGTEFKKVLDWSAKYDQSKLVRDMAVALGGAVPPPPPPAQEPPAQPTQESPQQPAEPNI